MDGYIEKALCEFKHTIPKQTYLGPSKYVQPIYGQKQQLTTIDDSEPIEPNQIRFIQQVIGKLLFYARAINHTMLHAINKIASAPKTEATLKATIHLLNYAACNPDASIIY